MANPKTSKLSGKKKGGAVFPRIGLREAIEYSKKLVSKTHTGAQPHTTIFPGVFGVSPNNTSGQVRASALKQYGLLQGKPSSYEATSLAKQIALSPDDEVVPRMRESFLRPRVFKVLFETFQGDLVSLSKLKQQAASSDVHPDVAEQCARLFIEGAVYASLGQSDGDTVNLIPSPTKVGGEKAIMKESGEHGEEYEEQAELSGDVEPVPPQNSNGNVVSTGASKAVIHVNVTIDSTLDTEKLERQLSLLRKYGAI